jgi:hypothetical protein
MDMEGSGLGPVEVQSQHLHADTKKASKELTEYPAFRQRFNPSTSRIQVQSFATTKICSVK